MTSPNRVAVAASTGRTGHAPPPPTRGSKIYDAPLVSGHGPPAPVRPNHASCSEPGGAGSARWPHPMRSNSSSETPARSPAGLTAGTFACRYGAATRASATAPSKSPSCHLCLMTKSNTCSGVGSPIVIPVQNCAGHQAPRLQRHLPCSSKPKVPSIENGRIPQPNSRRREISRSATSPSSGCDALQLTNLYTLNRGASQGKLSFLGKKAASTWRVFNIPRAARLSRSCLKTAMQRLYPLLR